MVFKFVSALGQQQLRHFKIIVWKLVTEHFFLFSLLKLNFAKELAIKPIWNLNLALLSLFKINGQPKRNVNGFRRFERTETARDEVQFGASEVWLDLNELVLSEELVFGRGIVS